ncbi:MAG: nucleotidyltransferase domain-containing protein [Magnetococcales bacterium]|nr:nucleotidyltransferase domain-containing protein [Magnetococcales bacterium]
MVSVTQEILDEMVCVIVEAVQPEQIVLFGSMARGEATEESDIDLLIVEKEGFTERSRWQELGRIRQLLAGFPMSKDILLYSHDEVMRWKKSLNHVVAEAMQDGKLLYDQDLGHCYGHHASSRVPACTDGGGVGGMGDMDQAETLRRMADKDYRALQVMLDPMQVDVEVFGLHVQRAVEKGLKAWLCILGVRFPKKHNLEELALLLKKTGAVIPDAFIPLLGYSDFASKFRYVSYPEFDEDIDRSATVVLVGGLLRHVGGQLAGVSRK